MSATLRHSDYRLDAREPLSPRRTAPRGASRLPQKEPREPLALRIPKANLSPLKRLFWPVLLLAGVLAIAQFGPQVLPYIDRPVSRISVAGDLSYVSQQAVQQRIEPFIKGSFFTVDLAGIRQSLEQIPWIKQVEVRRVWPDQLQIQLEEQRPVARWGENSLLNNAGVAFVPREISGYQGLPQLAGPQRAQQKVMQHYQLFSQLLRPMGLTIARLEMRERGSWYLTTNQGFDLLLGRDHLLEKLHRLAVIYDKALKAEQGQIERIDLRYPNGLAVAKRAEAQNTTQGISQ